jgi:hypothetical protein
MLNVVTAMDPVKSMMLIAQLAADTEKFLKPV